MHTEIPSFDALQICDLEYDVAGAGSAEATSSEVNLAAFIFYFSMPIAEF